MAGLRGQMLGSVKVTASEESKPYAGVTVSMTSGESKTSDKCDSGSHLSSPQSGSAKYRQRRSSMQEVTVTSRNAINGLASSQQMIGKEKGPRPALRVMQLITCEESNELHHNSHLQATGNLAYSRHQHLKKTGAGFDILNSRADRISRSKVRFFTSVSSVVPL
ncbi:hypothetical protein SODG_006424 [Sodalis praecaptivus]